MTTEKTLGILVSAGLMLIVIGLILSIGAEITTETKENSGDVTGLTVSSELVTSAAAGNTLTCSGTADSPAQLSISSVSNGSGSNETYVSGNWTVISTDSSKINFTTSGDSGDGSGHEATGTIFIVNYSCSQYGLVWATGVNGTLSLNELAGWQDTIAIVIAAVVIIGLLLAGFGAFLYFR